MRQNNGEELEAVMKQLAKKLQEMKELSDFSWEMHIYNQDGEAFIEQPKLEHNILYKGWDLEEIPNDAPSPPSEKSFSDTDLAFFKALDIAIPEKT